MESVTQENIFLTVAIGHFSARSSKWWTDDKTTKEALKTENLLSRFSISQVISGSTQISINFNSCIDLLFTNEQNYRLGSFSLHRYPSLHSNCHHQIIYGMFNFKIFILPRMKDVFGITNMQMLIWFLRLLKVLTGIKYS